MKRLGILTNIQRFVCLPAQPTCLSFLLAGEAVGGSFKKLQFLCYSFPCSGELRFEVQLCPASSLRCIFGKTHFQCNSPEPMGLSSPSVALGVPLWRWYSYSACNILELAALSVWVQETLFTKGRVTTIFYLLRRPHVVSFSFTFPYCNGGVKILPPQNSSSSLQPHHQCLNIIPKR